MPSRSSVPPAPPSDRPARPRRGNRDRPAPRPRIPPSGTPCRRSAPPAAGPAGPAGSPPPSRHGGRVSQHLRHLQPMLVKLARQFHEIPRHRGPADRTVGHVRQHLVQRVAELVKQRPRVVIGQKRGVPLGEVADVHHDGPHLAAQLLLAAHGRTPRARPLRAAREVVADEDGHVRPVRVTSQARASGW
jgi:hypothetical protein